MNECQISDFYFSTFFLLGKAPMPRPGYKPQEPNGCGSYFLGIKVPGSVCTTGLPFLIDVVLRESNPGAIITGGSDHLCSLFENSVICSFKLDWGKERLFKADT